MWGGVNAQTFEVPKPLPNPRDVRSVYIKMEFSLIQFSASMSVNDDRVLLNEVIFNFPNFSIVPNLSNHQITLNFGDGTPSVPVAPSSAILHAFPINTSADGVPFTIRLEIDGVEASNFILFFNKSNSIGGANFNLPNVIHPVTSTKQVPPPIANAFPNNPDGSISVYNGNTLGSADAYIQYAPSHNGKLIKPLIFVDGIDFDETVYTYNGQTVRHGSTGWDVFQFGNSGGVPSSFVNEESEYGRYPEALHEIGSAPNDYDIVFVDFSRGSDWIQKNGEVLIELIKW
jgi:hypothetical protein